MKQYLPDISEYFNEALPPGEWFWVSPDNQRINVPALNHKDYIMRKYSDQEFGWDYDRVFDHAIKDGWVRGILEPRNRFGKLLNLNGYDKSRVTSVYHSMFADHTDIKYGDNMVYLEWDYPEHGITRFSPKEGMNEARNEIDAWYELDEYVRDEIHKQIKDLESGVTKQKWELLEPAQLRLLLSKTNPNHAHIRAMAHVADALITDIARLWVNTVMSGHTPESPGEFMKQHGYYFKNDAPEDMDDYELNWTEDEFDELTDEYYLHPGWKQWAISDYAMKPLNDLANQLLQTEEDDWAARTILVSKILNVAHQRGDIAALFVKGGSSSLDWLEEV